MMVARPFRDAAFAVSVKAAYFNTCAMTGLQIINGGGRAEVQAAHIRPVAAGGSDSVRNGLALSGTIHWMFDRALSRSMMIHNFGSFPVIYLPPLPIYFAQIVIKLVIPSRPEISRIQLTFDTIARISSRADASQADIV